MHTQTAAEAVADKPVDTAAPPRSSKRVYVALACCSGALLLFCIVAAPRGGMHTAIPLIEAVLLLTPPLLVPAAFLHEKKAWRRRDAVLMLPWTLLIAMLITQAAPTTATFGYPLKDELWRSLDQRLGISVPAVMAWAVAHPLMNKVLTGCYAWALHPIILLAIFLPALFGKLEAAQRFVLANAFSFVVALPFMLFLPAVGPWIGWHFQPTGMQKSCEATIYALRQGSVIIKDAFGGIVCLPSFHVFWAVVSAHALWPFRYLRYPAIVVAALVTASTITTGWHYGVDVIAGLLMWALCTYFSNLIIAGRFRLPFLAGGD